MKKSLLNKNTNAIRVIATTSGVFFGLFSGVNHGIFEILQGNTPTTSLLIQAIGPAQRFWVEGTEEAFTLVPNFMVTGILSVIVGLAIVIWSIWFLPTKHGRTVFLGLFILSFLVGGGIGQVAFFIPAWAFSTRMDKPLTWWKKTLPQGIRSILSQLWVVFLITAIVIMLMGLEIAILGYVPGMSNPDQIQSIAMSLVFISALTFVISFIAGICYELEKRDQTWQKIKLNVATQ